MRANGRSERPSGLLNTRLSVKHTHSPVNLSILAIDVLSSKDLLSIGNTPALETSDVAS